MAKPSKDTPFIDVLHLLVKLEITEHLLGIRSEACLPTWLALVLPSETPQNFHVHPQVHPQVSKQNKRHVAVPSNRIIHINELHPTR